MKLVYYHGLPTSTVFSEKEMWIYIFQITLVKFVVKLRSKYEKRKVLYVEVLVSK